MSFFFSFLSFSVFLRIERERERKRERERERERVYKIEYKEKQSQNYLSYLDGFLWRIFLLLRALFFYPEFLALVPSATNPVQELIFSFLFSLTGRRCQFRFRVPANHLASTFFLPVSGDSLGLLDVTPVPFFIHQVTKYKHLFFHSDLGLLLWNWPTFFHIFTVILWWLANSNTRIVVILFLSSLWDVTVSFIPEK